MKPALYHRKQGAVRAEPAVRVARILVPYDFAEISKNALRYAQVLARRLGASLTLLHVVRPIVRAADFGYGPVTTQRPDYELVRRRQARLNVVGKRLANQRSQLKTLVRTGTEETEIVQAARELGSDLVVLGAHEAGSSGQPLPDSTAEKVAHCAPCPVLLVRKKPRTPPASAALNLRS